MNSIWDIINIPMGYVMRFLNSISGNQYVISLFLFAIFIELLLLPMGIKQQKNSIKQAKLRPKEMAIRKKYAGRDDNVTKQKITEEIQALYQKEGYSPFSGCLPMLIQLPILLALYYIVLNPMRYICQLSTDAINNVITVVKSFTGKAYDASRTIELMDDVRSIITEHGIEVFKNIEGFTDKISGVADLPKLDFFGFNLSGVPSFTNPDVSKWLLLIPVLTFLSYFFSMRLTRKFMYQPTTAGDAQNGCSTKMMDYTMPLMSVYICFIVPAAVSVYWIFKSLIGIVKQWALHKAMPTPVFTEEDYKAAEKEYATKTEKAPKKTSNGPRPGVRSLHHIDDEDFADTAPLAAARKAAEEEASNKEEKTSEGEKKTVVEAAPIKDDTRPKRNKKDKDTNDNENK